MRLSYSPLDFPSLPPYFHAMRLKLFLKILLGLGFLGVAVTAYVFIRAFFLTDVSRMPLENELEEPIYVASYAAGHEVFRKNQKTFAYSALHKGIGFIFNYQHHLIDPAFLEKHKNVFAKRKGAGYWLWKPWVVMNTLKQIPENAYLIYCDGGFTFEKNPKPFLDLLKDHDMVVFAYGGPLGSHCKPSALIKTHTNTEAGRKSPALLGGVLFMKNTPTTRHFVGQWLKYCEDDDLLLYEDGPGNAHRADESMLAVTYFHNPKGVFVIKGTEKIMYDYLRYHHRHPAAEDQSLMFKLDNGTRGWERRLVDSDFFKQVAKWIYKASRNTP